MRSYAIDAAGLAGGRAFETDLREDDIVMFFEANFPPGYMDAQLAPGHPIITFDDEDNTVTIVAWATIPTRFMNVAGVNDMTVSARTALVNILYGDREEVPQFWVGVVPMPPTPTSARSTTTGWSRRPTTRMPRGRTPIPPARPTSATMRTTISPRPGRAAWRRAS